MVFNLKKLLSLIICLVVIFSSCFIINRFSSNNLVEKSNNFNEGNENQDIDNVGDEDSFDDKDNILFINLNENDNNEILLSRKCTFKKSFMGDSMVKIKIPKNANATISFIFNDCNVDSGYTIIIISKKGPDDGVEIWEAFRFWKHENLLLEPMDNSTRFIEFKPGTIDLFILSNFGKCGVIIDSDLPGPEYIYEMPIINNVIFEATEYGQTIEDESPFGEKIVFDRSYFNVTSSAFLFRFLQIGGEYDGYGVQYDELILKSYNPDGEEHSDYYHRKEMIYVDNNKLITVIYCWDAVYAEKGVWSTTGSITLKTYGTPNWDNVDIRMFELVVYF